MLVDAITLNITPACLFACDGGSINQPLEDNKYEDIDYVQYGK